MLLHIKLNNIESVKKFVEIANGLESDILVKSGRYVVDGKSIMGLFSLNLLEVLDVEIIEKEYEEANKFYRQIQDLDILV
jgi:phosphotransferase system HPr-like phosphotransfer protein